MLRSMTGYGRSQQQLGGRDISVEIRSVNHRFLEASIRVPRAYGYLEEKLKAFLQSRVSRGKVDVSVTVYALDGQGTEVELNRALARGYVEALRGLSEELSLRDDLSLSAVARFGDIFTVRRAPEDEEAVWADVQQVAARALDGFVAMREAEGARLRADLLEKLDGIAARVEQVEALAPQTVQRYRERLAAKMQEVLADRNIDEQRLVQEAAIFADRVAVDEETVRLRSHLAQFGRLLEAGEPVGRKLDFLVQEMNREANTIGSKAQDVAVTGLVVEIKSEIEKIREQIQNIE